MYRTYKNKKYYKQNKLLMEWLDVKLLLLH